MKDDMQYSPSLPIILANTCLLLVLFYMLFIISVLYIGMTLLPVPVFNVIEMGNATYIDENLFTT